MRYLMADNDNNVEYFVFDIDGVIADISHRLDMIPGRPGVEGDDWEAYHAAGENDDWLPGLTLVNKLYVAGYNIILVTNRPDSNRAVTEAWLSRVHCRYTKLLMRAEGHHGSKEWAVPILDSYRVVMAFDDDPKHVAMYWAHGIVAVHWHSGYYDNITDEVYHGEHYVRSN
jgi:hypothetical protein